MDSIKTADCDLNKFSQEFRDEGHLREVLRDLLIKSGATGVRIEHGRNERGKDIVFYRPGGLSGDALYACVVKKDRITGRADSNSGAQTVFNQALAALCEPYADRVTGAEQRVHTVYIMSPYECTGDATESIKHQLREQARRVEFCCGIDLLALFQQHWPDFLRFESAILTRYLSLLRSGLMIDNALLSLLTRHNANSGLRPFEAFYIPGGIEITLDRFAPPDTSVPLPDALRRHMTLTEAKEVCSQLTFWKYLLRSQELTGETLPDLAMMSKFVERFTSGLDRIWAKSLSSKQMRKVESAKVEERILDVSEEDHGVFSATVSVFSRLRLRIMAANRAAARVADQVRHTPVVPRALLSDPDFLTMTTGYDHLNAMPGFVRYTRGPSVSVRSTDLLSENNCVLLVGPPGCGKTSFCRWQTLQAISAFSADPTKPLPIYIAAHKLSSRQLSEATFEEVFLAGLDVADFLRTSEKKAFRLFLDGLDEVPDRDQQKQILLALQSGLKRYPWLSSLITARPYVWGAWLSWLPRVQMSELSVGEQRQLAAKWLFDSAQVDCFFRELDRSPALSKLMGVPLLGTLILNLYRRAPTIPENKASLYRTFVDLYCGGWDTAKGVRNPGKFRTEQKLRPLSHMAYWMHLNSHMDCTEGIFRQAVEHTIPSLVENSSDLLCETIQDGILVRSGRHLLFAHLSFQEYLAAQFLASDPRGERPQQALRHYLRGLEWWKDVVEFYMISRDDPIALDDWIRHVALRVLRSSLSSGRSDRSSSQNPREDLRHRLQALATVMHETFPGYRVKFETDQSLVSGS